MLSPSELSVNQLKSRDLLYPLPRETKAHRSDSVMDVSKVLIRHTLLLLFWFFETSFSAQLWLSWNLLCRQCYYFKRQRASKEGKENFKFSRWGDCNLSAFGFSFEEAFVLSLVALVSLVLAIQVRLASNSVHFNISEWGLGAWVTSPLSCRLKFSGYVPVMAALSGSGRNGGPVSSENKGGGAP